MWIAIIILFILCVIVDATLFWKICSEKYNNIDRASTLFLQNVIVMLTFIFLSAIIGNYTNTKIPTALDVYRGKTELQITKTMINDSIVEKCDTIVLFKKN